MPFQFHRLEIPEVILVEAKRIGDARGFFMETYKQTEFMANGVEAAFVQDNCSRSSCGVLRGLHYQNNPYAQGKLLNVVQGEIFDVAVDIRHGSPTFGGWVGEVLSEENGRMLYVPPGFAHGFCVFSDFATLTYKVSDVYAPECERGILWCDPDIGIDWPIDDPILSARDMAQPGLQEAEYNFVYGQM